VADPLSTYDEIFEDAGKAWNVDPLLLKSIAKQESGGNPRLVGTSGEQGMMQIMPRTQRELGVTDPFDPVQSIFGGAKYLSQGLDKEGNPEGALLYYNGGPGWRNNYATNKGLRDYPLVVTSHYKALSAAQRAAQPPSPASAPSSPAAPAANPPVSPGFGPLTSVPGAPTVVSVPPLPAVNGLKPNG
jgi:soluble lytic murein transglycosylase-like protein